MSLFTLKNGKMVFCDKPTKIGQNEVIATFDAAYSRFIGGKTMWAIDVGTSCGDSTVVMAANLGPGSRIICFEPSREIFPLLKENLSKNPSLDCDFDLHNLAAGDSFSAMEFDYVVDNGGLVLPGILHPRTQPPYVVQVVHTTDYLSQKYSVEELSKIGFIKIDTEGYDYAVLRGLAPLICQNKPTIICEWWNDPFNSIELFSAIELIGYNPYNSRNELVKSQDFASDKRTQDLYLLPK